MPTFPPGNRSPVLPANAGNASRPWSFADAVLLGYVYAPRVAQSGHLMPTAATPQMSLPLPFPDVAREERLRALGRIFPPEWIEIPPQQSPIPGMPPGPVEDRDRKIPDKPWDPRLEPPLPIR